MTTRGRWLRAIVIAFLVTLILGRWLALNAADHLWADALGVGAAHAAIRRVRALLFSWAFVAASVWCVGNLYLVYRTIGSVRVPRRLANIEIVEALPPRALALGFVALGIALAWGLSYDADTWWYARALTRSASSTGITEPVLGRDAAFYLFALPWQRLLHGYATLLSGVVLGVCFVLYAAVGAMQVERRRFEIGPTARRHLGSLLVVFAMMLLWGYRLEPVEYVAGVHNIPYDTVLTDVRIPTARLLSVVAAVTAAASALWVRFDRVALVVGGWGGLATLSFLGHYLVPAVAAGVRTDDELHSPAMIQASEQLVRVAYGLGPTQSVAGAGASAASVDPSRPELAQAPIWDGFAVTALLNRLASDEPYLRHTRARLSAYRDPTGARYPVYVSAREVDLSAGVGPADEVTWERVHGGPYAFGKGVVAVAADRVGDRGLPHFIPDLLRPDSTVAHVTEVALRERTIAFGLASTDFAFASRADAPAVIGVRAGGWWRRLALAWRLQSPKLMTSASVDRETLLLWHRGVRERSERFAPFADFGDPIPVVADRRLYWLTPGYVASTTFPLSVRADWRGNGIRYLRAGFVGVVDAETGGTAVYLMPGADPLSVAWARLAPDIVFSWAEMPTPLKDLVTYPSELFGVQVALLAGRDARRAFGFFGRTGSERGRAGEEPFPWFGRFGRDSLARTSLVAVLQEGDPPGLGGWVEGTMSRIGPDLRVVRPAGPHALPGPSQFAARFAVERGAADGVAGPIKTVRLDDDFVAIQSAYRLPVDQHDAAGVFEVMVAVGGAVGRGRSLRDAMRMAGPPRATMAPTAQAWSDARRWFQRLDAARAAGDWNAFGRAYGELRNLFGTGRDSLP